MSTYQVSFGDAPKIEQIQGRWQASGLLTLHEASGCEHKFGVSISGDTGDSVKAFINTLQKECLIRPEVKANPGGASSNEVEPFAFVLPESNLTIKVTPQEIKMDEPHTIKYDIGVDMLSRGASFSAPPANVAKGGEWQRSVIFNASRARIDFHVSVGEVAKVTLREKNGHEGGTYDNPVRAKETISLPEEAGTYFEARNTKEWQVVVKGGNSSPSKFIITPLTGSKK